MFLEQTVKKRDLSKYAKDMPIQTGESSQFVLQREKIHSLITQIHNNPDKENIL